MTTLLSTYAIDAITPDVLTAMLRTDPALAGVEVVSLTHEPVGTGQMAFSHRIVPTYASDVAGAPRSLVAKLPSEDEASRALALQTSAYLREVNFYRDLAHAVDTTTPRCFHAELADDTVGFALLLEDLGPATAVDQLSGCSVDQAQLALEQIAALHGSAWGQPFIGADWLPTDAVWGGLAGAIGQISAPWLQRFGSYLTAEQVAVIERLGDHTGAWLRTLENRRTLWHGDYRVDNLLFDAQGGAVPLAVVDWQSVSVGPGVSDAAYFLGTSVDTALRGEHEADLLAAYHDALLRHGATDFTLEQCRSEVRVQSVFALVLTVPVSMGVQQTERGDQMFGAMAARAAQHVIDSDAYAALVAR